MRFQSKPQVWRRSIDALEGVEDEDWNDLKRQFKPIKPRENSDVIFLDTDANCELSPQKVEILGHQKVLKFGGDYRSKKIERWSHCAKEAKKIFVALCSNAAQVGMIQMNGERWWGVTRGTWFESSIFGGQVAF